MDFAGYFKKALEIITLTSASIEEISKDEEAFKVGLIFVAVAGLASAIGFLSPVSIIFNPIFYVVFSFIFAALFFFIAKGLFKGQGEFFEFYRPYSLAFILLWVSLIPVIGPTFFGFLASIWLAVCTVLIVEKVCKLERMQAIITVLIPVVVLTILALAGCGLAVILGLTALQMAGN